MKPEPSQRPDEIRGKTEREHDDLAEKGKGRNVRSVKPRPDAKERTDVKKLGAAWGELPDYVLKHGRGSMPEVPEKYRRYLEALTKPKGTKKRK